MIDKEEKTFEETIVAGNMDEAKKIAKESNTEAKIVSAKWVYKWFIFTVVEEKVYIKMGLHFALKVIIENFFRYFYIWKEYVWKIFVIVDKDNDNQTIEFLKEILKVFHKYQLK